MFCLVPATVPVRVRRLHPPWSYLAPSDPGGHPEFGVIAFCDICAAPTLIHVGLRVVSQMPRSKIRLPLSEQPSDIRS
jgi:hypothetical protein